TARRDRSWWCRPNRQGDSPTGAPPSRVLSMRRAVSRSGKDEDPAPHSPAFEGPMGFGRLGEVEGRADSAAQAPDREHPVDRLRRFGEIGGRGIADREAE